MFFDFGAKWSHEVLGLHFQLFLHSWVPNIIRNTPNVLFYF